MRRKLHDTLRQIWKKSANRCQSATPYLATLAVDNITNDILGYLVWGLAAGFFRSPPLVPNVLSDLPVVRVLWQFELAGVFVSVRIGKSASLQQMSRFVSELVR